MNKRGEGGGAYFSLDHVDLWCIQYLTNGEGEEVIFGG